MKIICPKCTSENTVTERILNGYSRCSDCGFKAKTLEFTVILSENDLHSEFDRKLIHGFLKSHIGDFMRWLNAQDLDPAEVESILANLEARL